MCAGPRGWWATTASLAAAGQAGIADRIRLPAPASAVATGEESMWALTRQPTPALWRIDPSSNRVVGGPTPLPADPWSLGVGAGAVWVADHAGWLVKIDPRTLKVVARQRLDVGPHGVVATRDGVYVADAHGSRLLEAGPGTAMTRRVAGLPVGPIYPAAGAGSIWSGSAAV